jgi:hypothetical protein
MIAHTRRVLAAAGLVALFAASPALAQSNALVVLDFGQLDPEALRAAPPALQQSLAANVGPTFKILPAKALEDLRNGAEPPVDMTPVTKPLAEAKAMMLNFQFKPAMAKLKAVQLAFKPLMLKMRDYQPLIDAHLYSAVAAMNSKKKKDAAKAFAALARLRPDHRIDPQQFPPAVMKEFDKARMKEARVARGRLVVNVNVPGAKIFVDELPSGNAPASVAVAPGDHVLRVEAPGHYSHAEAFKAASYKKVETTVTLQKNLGQAALKQLEEGYLNGMPPEKLIAAAQTVAQALNAAGVVMGLVGQSIDVLAGAIVFVPKQAQAHGFGIEFARDVAAAGVAGKELAGALKGAAASKAPFSPNKINVRVLGKAAPARKFNFTKYALGLGPNEVPDPPPRQVIVMQQGPTGPVPVKPEPPGLLSKWWFWAGAGVVAAAAGGGTYYMVGRPETPPSFTVQMVR